jgi:competence protein ComFC
VLKTLFLLILDFIYPPFCCYCQKIGKYLCHECYATIEFLSLPIQPRLEPLYLDQVISVCTYSNAIVPVIHSLKYKSVKDLGILLAQLTYFSTAIPAAHVIVPIPIHSSRRKQRGFNQTEEVAKELSRLTKIPTQNILQKNRKTQTQAKTKSRAQRMKNIQNSFALQVKSHLPLPPKVLLIDDVFTTGNTLNECAKVLKEHGCQKVFALTIAHE